MQAACWMRGACALWRGALPAPPSLPVAALDAVAAQAALWPAGVHEPNGVEAWLLALQLAQVASDRLLLSLESAQRSCRFWKARLQAGSPSSFMLLSLGPASFAADVVAALGAGAGKQRGRSASDRIQERVSALDALTTHLAEALSAVHHAAALLQPHGAAAAAAAGGAAAGQPAALRQAASACLLSLLEALARLLPAAEQLQRQEAAVRLLLHWPSAPGVAVAAPPQPLASAKEVQQQLLELLGVQTAGLVHRRGDAGSALAVARRLAAHLGPLVGVPAWARMPSNLQRHWIRYGAGAGLAAWAGLFLYCHSRLAGSSDLDDWIAAAVAGVKGAWSEHIVAPLRAVSNDAFNTFRSRSSIVSAAEFEADKQSLLRMLEEFQRDSGSGRSLATAAAAAECEQQLLLDSDAVNRGMQAVMRSYENDLKAPIRGLIGGELARTLLIQVQRLKLDTEAAMLELDQILRANELSISLVAAVPAMLVLSALLRGAWVLLAPRPPDPQREALPCRLAMADLGRALVALAGTADGPAAEGMALLQLSRVLCEAQRAYRLKAASRYSEWPHLRADLLELLRPDASVAAKVDLHTRMLRTYALLQP